MGLIVYITDLARAGVEENFGLKNPEMGASYEIPEGEFAGILQIEAGAKSVTFIGQKGPDSVTVDGVHLNDHSPSVAVRENTVINLKKGRCFLRLEVGGKNSTKPMHDSGEISLTKIFGKDTP